MDNLKKKISEKERQVIEQYEQALLEEKYDLASEIEDLYKNTSLWGRLRKTKKEIDEALIA